jgi:hypothetical protein
MYSHQAASNRKQPPATGKENTMNVNITDRSKTLFVEYAKDAGNWNGNPLVGLGGNVTTESTAKEERGNLTQLKKAGLVTTFNDGRDQFLDFTDKGREYAESLGIDLYRWGAEKPTSPANS